MTADRTTTTNELADEIANYGSLIERGQLTQPRKIGRELKQIATALRAAANPTEVEPVPTVWLGTPDPKALAARLRDPSLSAYRSLRHEAAAMLESLSPSPGKAGDVRAALELARKWIIAPPGSGYAEDFKADLAKIDAALAVTHHYGGAV